MLVPPCTAQCGCGQESQQPLLDELCGSIDLHLAVPLAVCQSPLHVPSTSSDAMLSNLLASSGLQGNECISAFFLLRGHSLHFTNREAKGFMSLYTDISAFSKQIFQHLKQEFVYFQEILLWEHMQGGIRCSDQQDACGPTADP